MLQLCDPRLCLGLLKCPLSRRFRRPRCLNAQPMGFYSPAQIVRDVREHGVECAGRTSIIRIGIRRSSLGRAPPSVCTT